MSNYQPIFPLQAGSKATDISDFSQNIDLKSCTWNQKVTLFGRALFSNATLEFSENRWGTTYSSLLAAALSGMIDWQLGIPPKISIWNQKDWTEKSKFMELGYATSEFYEIEYGSSWGCALPARHGMMDWQQ